MERLSKSKAHERTESTRVRQGKLKSKALLLGESERSTLKSKAILLGETLPQNDYDTKEPAELETRQIWEPARDTSTESSEGEDSDELEPFWTPQHGIRFQPKRLRHQKVSQEEIDTLANEQLREIGRRDKYFLYPMLAVTSIAALTMIVLVGHAFILDGTAKYMLQQAARLCLAIVLSFLVLIQFTFFYEHYYKTPSFRVHSHGFIVSYILVLIIVFIWPVVGICSLAGSFVAAYIFNILGLSAKPGSVFPLIFFPCCSYFCYATWPVFIRVGSLLQTSLMSELMHLHDPHTSWF